MSISSSAIAKCIFSTMAERGWNSIGWHGLVHDQLQRNKNWGKRHKPFGFNSAQTNTETRMRVTIMASPLAKCSWNSSSTCVKFSHVIVHYFRKSKQINCIWFRKKYNFGMNRCLNLWCYKAEAASGCKFIRCHVIRYHFWELYFGTHWQGTLMASPMQKI